MWYALDPGVRTICTGTVWRPKWNRTRSKQHQEAPTKRRAKKRLNNGGQASNVARDATCPQRSVSATLLPVGASVPASPRSWGALGYFLSLVMDGLTD